ncbi:MAG: histidine--tRNA ligase [Rhodoluna sp.]
MASQINPPRGMRDFLPQEKAIRNELLAKIVGSYASHGFQEIETPALEAIERLSSGDGGDNEKLAFKVLKRGEDLEQAIGQNPDDLADLGLRYDLTVPLTRYYATNHAKLPKVFKAIQVGPVWRAERPQKGRYRQFVQCDIDIIGDESVIAEVELLNASMNALKAIGITEAKVRVNHRQLLTLSIKALGLSDSDQAKAMVTIDKLDKVGIGGVEEEMKERFGDKVSQATADWLNSLSSDLPVPKELKELFSSVESLHPGALRFDPTLVRGMGYYTGAIFEIEHPASGVSIGGGGRYDGMVGKWLGTATPAVGISIGFERVAELVAASSTGEKLLVLIFDADNFDGALLVQAEAIAAGYSVRLEPKPKKLNLVLETLNTQGFKHFAVLEEPESGLKGLNIKPIS